MAQDQGDSSGGSYHDFSGLGLDAISAIVDADHDSLPRLKASMDACRELRDLLIEQRDVLGADLDTLNANYSSPSVTPVVEGQFERMTSSIDAMIDNADGHYRAIDSMIAEVERVKPVIDGLKTEREQALRMNSENRHAFDALGDPNTQTPGIEQVQVDIDVEAREEFETASMVYQVEHSTRMDPPPTYRGPQWSGGAPVNPLDVRTRGFDPGPGPAPVSTGRTADLGDDGGAPDLQGPAAPTAPAPNPVAPAPSPAPATPPPSGGPVSTPPVVAPGGQSPARPAPPTARPGPTPPATTRPTGTPSLRPPTGSPTTSRGTSPLGPNRPTSPGIGNRGSVPTGGRPVDRPSIGRSVPNGTTPRGATSSAPGARSSARPSISDRSPSRAVVPKQSKTRTRRASSPRATRPGTSNSLADVIAKDLKARTERGLIGDRSAEGEQRHREHRSDGRVVRNRRTPALKGGPAVRPGSLTATGVVSSGLKEADRTWTRSVPTQSTKPAGPVIGRRASSSTSAKDDRRAAQAKRRRIRREILAGKPQRGEDMVGEWFDGVRDQVVPGVIGGQRDHAPNRVTRYDVGPFFGTDGWKDRF